MKVKSIRPVIPVCDETALLDPPPPPPELAIASDVLSFETGDVPILLIAYNLYVAVWSDDNTVSVNVKDVLAVSAINSIHPEPVCLSIKYPVATGKPPPAVKSSFNYVDVSLVIVSSVGAVKIPHV